MESNAPAAFSHRAHLEHAIAELRKDVLANARERLAELFRAAAQSRGVPEKFNLTLTYCWAQLVAAALANETGIENADQLIARRPEFADGELPLRYYRRVRLFSDEARVGYLPPDLECLPLVERSDRPPHV